MAKSPKKSKKEPVVNRTAEEILADLAKQKAQVEAQKAQEKLQEEQRQKVIKYHALISKEIYPRVVKAYSNALDARTFLSTLSSLIMQSGLEMLRNKKFGELNLERFVGEKDPNRVAVVDILTFLKDEPVYVARDLVEDTGKWLEKFVNKDLAARKLDTLEANFTMDPTKK